MRPIGRLHIITDTSPEARHPHVSLSRLALEGGADTIQYRRKNAATRLLLEEATEIRALCRRHNIPLIVNDRVDVALFADADGVHLGADDLPLAPARELLGPNRLIGGSSDQAEEAAARAREGADYAGIGPIFPTTSKADAGPVVGIAGLARAVQATSLPLIAIGGITLENVDEVLATGVHGIAVLSAISRADDPAAATAAFRAALERRGRGRAS